MKKQFKHPLVVLTVASIVLCICYKTSEAIEAADHYEIDENCIGVEQGEPITGGVAIYNEEDVCWSCEEQRTHTEHPDDLYTFVPVPNTIYINYCNGRSDTTNTCTPDELIGSDAPSPYCDVFATTYHPTGGDFIYSRSW